MGTSFRPLAAGGLILTALLLFPAMTMGQEDGDAAAQPLDPAAAIDGVAESPPPSPSPTPIAERATVVVVKTPPDEPGRFDVTYTDAEGTPTFVFGAPDDPVVVADFETQPGIGAAVIDIDPDWLVADAACDDPGETPTTIGPELSSVSFGIDPGEHVTCTFEVERAATFDVDIITVPADATGGQFEFSYDDRDPPRLVTFAGQANTFDGNKSLPGTHVARLTTEGGWITNTVDCIDSLGEPSEGDAVASTATLRLDPGEHVLCRFWMHRFGDLTIKVVADTPDADVSLPVKITNTTLSPSGGSGDYASMTVAAGHAWELGPVPPNTVYIATVPDPPPPWRIRGGGCSGAETTGGSKTESSTTGSGWLAVASLRASDSVTCTFELSDRIIPKAGRWHAEASNHQGCPVGAEARSGDFTLVVKGDGNQLVLRSGGRSQTVRATGKRNVYKGRAFKIFEFVWTVQTEELIKGILRDTKGGCVSSSFTYRYRGK